MGKNCHQRTDASSVNACECNRSFEEVTTSARPHRSAYEPKATGVNSCSTRRSACLRATPSKRRCISIGARIPLRMQANKPSDSTRHFVHRHHANDSFDTFCLSCFRTVATTATESELFVYEIMHRCDKPNHPTNTVQHSRLSDIQLHIRSVGSR